MGKPFIRDAVTFGIIRGFKFERVIFNFRGFVKFEGEALVATIRL